jgi:F0F1-type ATP synthase assembly protein I
VPEDPNRSRKPNALVSAARYSEIGFIIPAAVFLGYAIGRLADYWLHTRWIYLAGVIFGAVVGFAQMIRMASALSSDKPDE